MNVPLPPIGPDGEQAPWKGVNLLMDPRRIRDDELVLSQNMVPVLPKVLSKRPPLSLSFATALPIGGTFPCNAKIVPFISNSILIGASRSIALSQLTTMILVLPGGATISTGVGGTGGQQVITKRYPAICFFQQQIIFSGGQPMSAFWFQQQNPNPSVPVSSQPFLFGGQFKSAQAVGGSTTVDFLGPGNYGVYAPRVVANYSDRLVYANFGPGFEQYLVFSDSLSKSTITPANIPFTVAAPGGGPLSRSLLIGGARDGDAIVACQEIMLTAIGSTPQKALLVLKENSAYLITGEPSQTTDPTSTSVFGNMVVSQIAFNCGCASADTVQVTPYGVIWAGKDDVWLFQFGQVPVRVGSKIRPALLRTPAQLRYRWHATYFDGFYRLAIDAPSGFGDDAPPAEQYWLDLREGPPQGSEALDSAQDAEWWGPVIYQNLFSNTVGPGLWNMFADTRSEQPPALYTFAGASVLNAGFNNLSVLRVDGPSGPRDVFWDASSASAMVTAGAEIVADVRTKNYGHTTSQLDKIVKSLDMNIAVDVDCTLNSDFVVDSGAVVDTEIRQLAANPSALDSNELQADSLGFGAPLLVVESQTQATRIYTDQTRRLIGKTHQHRLYDVPGYTIIAGVNDGTGLNISAKNGTSGQVGFVLGSGTTPALAPGFYTGAGALLAAFTALLNTLYAATSYSFTNTFVGNLVAITIASGGVPIFAMFNATGGLPQGPAFKLLGLLGYPTPKLASFAATQTATNFMWGSTVPVWEVASLSVNLGVIARRPT